MRVLLICLLVLLAGCGDDGGYVNGVPPAPLVIDSPDRLIEGLELSYRTRNYDLFAKLLANHPDRNAEYRFILDEPTEDGTTEWGYEEELRIHRRMFDPQDTFPGELPVPNDLWLQSVDITLTRRTEWADRPDLYSENSGADGLLDPAIWRAVSAWYSADVFFAMAGEVDYQVIGDARFTVIEDLAKADGEDGRFLIL